MPGIVRGDYSLLQEIPDEEVQYTRYLLLWLATGSTRQQFIESSISGPHAGVFDQQVFDRCWTRAVFFFQLRNQTPNRN